MFYFGGFGSVLPYFLYLSVVWICVLIGFRGQFFSFFTSGDETENIEVVEVKPNNASSTANTYFFSNYRDTKENLSDNKSYSLKDFSGFVSIKNCAAEYYTPPDKLILNAVALSHFLRAPPQLTI